MNFRTRLKLLALVVIATLSIALTLLLIPPGNHSIPGLTVLDSQLKIYDCFLSYGTIHSTVPHPLLTEVRERIWAVKNRFFHSPVALHFGAMPVPTGSNAVVLVLNLAWKSSPTNFFVEMKDAAGHSYPTHLELSCVGVFSNAFNACIARTVECPTPPPRGDYEFQILLGSNGPPVAKYKTTLNFR